MLQALLDDLADIPQSELVITRDVRLPPLSLPIEQIPISSEMDVWRCWEDCIRQADAVWIVAPESGGMLERLSQLVLRHGKCLLGSQPEAVKLAASKHATAAVLAAVGIDAVPTFHAEDMPDGADGSWVAKPDDGVGCEGTLWFADSAALHAWIRQGQCPSQYIVQPYVEGIPSSLSMLCRNSQAWLLSCNRQMISLQQGRFSYHGSVLNDMARQWEDFGRIASGVAAAIPGLAGYVGVDMIVGDGRISVLEVNPRLTTSYAGLRRAMGHNPARLVVDLLYNDCFVPPPVMTREVVNIALHE